MMKIRQFLRLLKSYMIWVQIDLSQIGFYL